MFINRKSNVSYLKCVAFFSFIRLNNSHISSKVTIGNPLLDKFMKDLIIQILAMVSEQERNESKRRQAQGIQVAKEKGVYKGRPLLYSPNAKDPQKRIIYHRVVEMLEEGQAISKIAKEVNITRQTVYRIKHDKGLS